MAEFDVLLRGGTVVDGTGAPGVVRDVGIVGDRVTAIDDLSAAQAATDIDRRVPLENPLSLVRWNVDKTYLRDLDARGVPIVPTVWRERLAPGGLGPLFDRMEKKRVWRQSRIARTRAELDLQETEEQWLAELLLEG